MAMVNFTDTKKDLFEKYNINLGEISSTIKCDENLKKSLVYHLLSCYELARKNLLKGNLTASSYACGIVLSDNTVHFGVNFNHTRNEISSICAEREAILETFNSKVNEFDPDKNLKFDYEIKYILMSTYTKEGKFWADKMAPCADCLSWFNTGVNLSKETKICFLKKDDKGNVVLNIEPLENLLPLRNLVYKTVKNINQNTKIKRSKLAKENQINDDKLIKLYEATLKAYKKNTLSGTSEQNVAAGAIINGEIFTGIKVDFSKRWFIEPLMAACYKGFEKYGTNSSVDAVCFVGEEYTLTESNRCVKDGIVSIKTLGRINTRFASNKTIVLTGADDYLTAYTIGDYMPGDHKFIHTYRIK